MCATQQAHWVVSMLWRREGDENHHFRVAAALPRPGGIVG